MLDNSRWLLGSGDNVDFLRDNWAGNGPILSADQVSSRDNRRLIPLATVSEVLRDSQHMAWSFIGDTWQSPRLHIIDVDRYFWKRTAEGTFTVKSAYNLIRSKGVRRSAWAKL